MKRRFLNAFEMYLTRFPFYSQELIHTEMELSKKEFINFTNKIDREDSFITGRFSGFGKRVA